MFLLTQFEMGSTCSVECDVIVFLSKQMLSEALKSVAWRLKPSVCSRAVSLHSASYLSDEVAAICLEGFEVTVCLI